MVGAGKPSDFSVGRLMLRRKLVDTLFGQVQSESYALSKGPIANSVLLLLRQATTDGPVTLRPEPESVYEGPLVEGKPSGYKGVLWAYASTGQRVFPIPLSMFSGVCAWLEQFHMQQVHNEGRLALDGLGQVPDMEISFSVHYQFDPFLIRVEATQQSDAVGV